ncbi:hypothetical protein ACA910_009649 [Epithemia clementina (nom. ined.)]
MRFDVKALKELTSAEQPPERLLRPNKFGSQPTYIFGDASGSGYGTSSWTPGDNSTMVGFGAWDPANEGKEFSNCRELGNIVRRLEYLDQIGKLTDAAEFFIFTTKQSRRVGILPGYHKIAGGTLPDVPVTSYPD